MLRSSCPAIIGLLLLLAGCSPASPRGDGIEAGAAEPPRRPKHLTLALKGEPEHFVFDFAATGFGGVGHGDVQLAVYQGLMTNDDLGNVHPMLAAEAPSQADGSWLVRPDGTMQTTYRLRPNVTWHDGRPLVPADFVLGWTIANDRDIPMTARGLARLISRIDVLDGRTLVLEWERTYPFANAVVVGDLNAVPVHLLESAYRTAKDRFTDLPYWKREFVGLGPYRVAEWEPGSHMTLRAYEAFYAGPPKIDVITIRFFGDPQPITAGLLGGTVDGIIKNALDFDSSMFVKDEWERAGKRPLVVFQTTHWRMLGQHRIERGESIVSTVKRSNEEIRTARGRIDAEKVKAATDADINRWKRQDGVDDAALGPARFVSPGLDVRLLRERLGLSQEAFAGRFHLSLRTVQEWEQQRRVPEGPARVLLRVIERNPEAVDRALVGQFARAWPFNVAVVGATHASPAGQACLTPTAVKWRCP